MPDEDQKGDFAGGERTSLAYPKITLRRYPVTVRGEDVVVTLGG